MNIVDFSNWLLSNGTNKKVVSDIVSRLKRINRELMSRKSYTTIDNEYSKDKCRTLLKSFDKAYTENNLLVDSNLPLDKPYLASYKYALNKYLHFLNQ